MSVINMHCVEPTVTVKIAEPVPLAVAENGVPKSCLFVIKYIISLIPPLSVGIFSLLHARLVLMYLVHQLAGDLLQLFFVFRKL